MTDNFYIKIASLIRSLSRTWSPSRARPVLPGLICLFFLWGCAITPGTPGNGIYHTVKKGETLWRISKIYGVDVKDLASANAIKSPSDLEAGKRIFIPAASAVKPSNKQTKNKKATAVIPAALESVTDVEKEHLGGRVRFSREKFLWPVRGSLSSHFGLRDGVRHDGIDIRVPEGTPVKAADAGQVAYISTNMRGYGNIIILKHRDGFYTVYAHNKNNLVNPGDTVNKGAVIATAGATGNAQAAQLHFEVRQGRHTLDPLFYLP